MNELHAMIIRFQQTCHQKQRVLWGRVLCCSASDHQPGFKTERVNNVPFLSKNDMEKLSFYWCNLKKLKDQSVFHCSKNVMIYISPK